MNPRADTHLRSDQILERLLGLHPKLIDLSLGRMRRLLKALDHPEKRLNRVIHIAGTNGKGSTLAFLRAMIEASGQKVNAYTSPHLVDFHERIRVQSTLIAEPLLNQYLERCEQANGGEPITFFEVTTAAALLAFAEHPADVTLLEVGLGGRLDATNVVDRPELTIITPVSLDHQEFLGINLGDIAFEKAGILKPGIPVVIGPQHPEALKVIKDRAHETASPLHVCGEDWHMEPTSDGFRVTDVMGEIHLPKPRLLGEHQLINAATAVAAMRRLGRFKVKPDAMVQAMTTVEWPARLQPLSGKLLEILPKGSSLWLDGGHNPDAARVLVNHFEQEPDRIRPLHLVVGLLKTKDVLGFLHPWQQLNPTLQCVTIPGEKNAMESQEIVRIAEGLGLVAKPAHDIFQALENCALSGGAVRVLICGSLYLAGKVLAI